MRNFIFLFSLLFLAACYNPGKEHPVLFEPTETPDSLRFCRSLNPLPTPAEVRHAVGLKGNFWEKGKVLRVGFMGATAQQIAFVKSALAEWDTLTNLTFTYPASGPYELRWAFKPNDGAWSYVGTDCLNIPQNQPTGNIGWGWDTQGRDGVARHECGHAIGAMHEHQNGNSGICWNAANVYSDLALPPNSWDKQTVDYNILQPLDPKTVVETKWDSTSIMHYGIPARWRCQGASAIPSPMYLSAQDKAFWATIYPNAIVQPPTTVTITNLQAAAVLAKIVATQTAANAAVITTKKALGL